MGKDTTYITIDRDETPGIVTQKNDRGGTTAYITARTMEEAARLYQQAAAA